MSIPTSLTAFIAALGSYQEVASETIADRVASLRGRLKAIEEARTDDRERLDARTKERTDQLRTELTGKIARLKEELTSDIDLIDARYVQERETLEMQIAGLLALNDSLIIGTPAQKPDFAAQLGNAIEADKPRPALPKAKDSPPIWRDQKPITEMTDAELDSAIGVKTLPDGPKENPVAPRFGEGPVAKGGVTL